MRLGADHVRVQVPATSANLGPGFDALGLALEHRDEIEVRALGSADVVVDVVGEGAGEVPTGADHLVVRSLRAALEHVGAPLSGLHLRCTNRIPHGRGLGSSAAAVVAGILAARALVADPDALDDTTALQLATQFEGHPDNAAPALLGGATVAWSEPGGARAVALDVHPEITPLVLVPDHCLATHTARRVLPSAVPHPDAAFTAGRAALLVEALTRRPDLLLPATAEKLHQTYRMEVMPQSMAIVSALRASGVPAVISGAGPTVLILSTAGRVDAHRALVEDLLVDRGATADWRVLTLPVARTGGTVQRL